METTITGFKYIYNVYINFFSEAVEQCIEFVSFAKNNIYDEPIDVTSAYETSFWQVMDRLRHLEKHVSMYAVFISSMFNKIKITEPNLDSELLSMFEIMDEMVEKLHKLVYDSDDTPDNRLQRIEFVRLSGLDQQRTLDYDLLQNIETEAGHLRYQINALIAQRDISIQKLCEEYEKKDDETEDPDLLEIDED